MRNKTEPRHTFSIYLPTSLYQKLVDKAGKGKISTFIKEMLEKNLTKEEQKEKQGFQQKLKRGYQAMAKNKKIKQELAVWDETLGDSYK